MTIKAIYWSLAALSALRTVVYASPHSIKRIAASVPPKSIVRRIDANTVEVAGVRVRSAAYISRNYDGAKTSRYDMNITRKPADGTQWRLADEASWYDLDWVYNGIEGATSVVPYSRKQRTMQAACYLIQADTREERVTFHGLDIKRSMGLGFLIVTKAQSVITPDGVTVTLPIQNMQTSPSAWCYNGPPDVVCARVLLSPGGRRRVLPASTLYQRYKVPVNLYVRAAAPLVTNSRADDNPVQDIHITLPDKQATHLDTPTLVIRQVSHLQTIPLKFEVPIDRSRHE